MWGQNASTLAISAVGDRQMSGKRRIGRASPAAPGVSRRAPDLTDLAPLLLEAGRLKTTQRAGWARVGLPSPESVAEHSYRLALLAALVAPRLGLERARLVLMALLHDLPEAHVGDIMPSQGIPLAEKRRREADALVAILGGLPEAAELHGLYREYREGASPEAAILPQLDKLEMALQALEYELAHTADLSEFWASARAGITHPSLMRLLDALETRRPRRGQANLASVPDSV
jgi:putative hydrolase of HD superfamily